MPQTLIQIAWMVLGLVWLAVVAFTLFKLVSDSLKKRKSAKHVADLKWIILELKIPKENLKTPQAMEQVFTSLHALSKDDWISVELVGFSHSTHFIIRLPEQYRNLAESSIFSQYPDAEVVQTEDYVDRFGSNLPNEVYDLAGAELTLERDNVYPIRTYPSFERNKQGEEVEQYLDPIATIAEVMSALKEDEMIWLQVAFRPVPDFKAWEKEVKDVLEELLGRKPKKKKFSFSGLFEWIEIHLKNLILAPIQNPVWPGGEKKEEKSQGKQFSYGENEVIKAIETKFSKFAFESCVRVIYIDSKDSFTKSNVSSVTGALRQFSAPHLNSFKLDDPKLNLIAKTFRKNKAEQASKKKLFRDYRERALPKKPLILNAEELASLYHPPHSTVGAEKLVRLSMKKGGPPPDLPVIS